MLLESSARIERKKGDFFEIHCAEKEKQEGIWKRIYLPRKWNVKRRRKRRGYLEKIFLGGREENGEGKGGKYLEYSIALCSDNFQPSVKWLYPYGGFIVVVRNIWTTPLIMEKICIYVHLHLK